MPSSLTISPSGRLENRPFHEVFATIADPRKPRGVRHRLASVLTIAQCAVLAGAKTLVAVHEWMLEGGPRRVVPAWN